MDRALQTLLIMNELRFNECNEEIRMVNCDGLSIMFDEKTWTGKGENFQAEIYGFAGCIKLLKTKEKQHG